MTAAVWARGALLHEFGVAPEDMEWWMERTEQTSHGGATGFQPPEGVTLNRIPQESNIGMMMAQGELDAAVFYHANPASVDRSRIDLMARPDIRYLFPDAASESERYYQKTGLHPHQPLRRGAAIDTGETSVGCPEPVPHLSGG